MPLSQIYVTPAVPPADRLVGSFSQMVLYVAVAVTLGRVIDEVTIIGELLVIHPEVISVTIQLYEPAFKPIAVAEFWIGVVFHSYI